MKAKCTILIVAIFLTVATCKAQETEKNDKPNYTSFSAAIFKDKYKQDAILVDVRTSENFTNSHLLGAILVNKDQQDFAKKAEALDKNRNLFVYGNTSEESKNVCELLANLGFVNVYQLNGSFNELVSLGMKVTK